jgi:hypothetical protein
LSIATNSGSAVPLAVVAAAISAFNKLLSNFYFAATKKRNTK